MRLLTRYLRSSSNLSSNLWIFFFSTWILLVSCAVVSSSFSSSQEPREELRLRLETARGQLQTIAPPENKNPSVEGPLSYLTKE